MMGRNNSKTNSSAEATFVVASTYSSVGKAAIIIILIFEIEEECTQVM
jgi:hypothetical protein